MATPEQGPEIPPVQEIPDIPEVSPEASEMGISAVPSTPPQQQNQDDNQQPQPVPAPPSDQPSITVPAQNQQALEQMAKGNIADSQTWFGTYWLYKIKKAVKDGLQIIFGGNK